MKHSYVFFLYYPISVGCSSGGGTSLIEAGSREEPQVVEVSSLDPMARLPWDAIDGLAELTASMSAPGATPVDGESEDAGVGRLSPPVREADAGVRADGKLDGGASVAIIGAGMEGQLCLYGERDVVGVELGGECQVPPVRSYALTCGGQRCEKDWCDTEYRDPGGAQMVSGMLYCAEDGCMCRCPGVACVRNRVIYCGTTGC